jgi:beta-galactosidase
MMAMPYLAGFAAWNFADFGSERRGDAIPSVNQKGLVNFDRSEKDVIGLYKAYFLKEPVVHIASHNYSHRTGIEQSKDAGFSLDSIKVFSNREIIELKLNGKTLGKKEVIDHEVTFAVPFKGGKNYLTATDGNGHTDQIDIVYKLIPYHLDAPTFEEIAVNVGAEVSFYDPKEKILWVPDRKYSPRSWGYEGGAPYTTQRRQLKTGIDKNILGTQNDPLFQTFIEGITSYRFDISHGRYTLQLCFQEPISSNNGNNMYNLTNRDESTDNIEAREFGITVNGQNMMNKLNLREDYGSLRAVTFDFEIEVNNGTGLKIDFQPISGEALLNSIRLKRIN